jgi:hypothetical protein
VTQQGGHLTLALPPNANANLGIATNGVFDLNGRSVQVDVPRYPSAPNTQSLLAVLLDQNNTVSIIATPTDLTFASQVAGTPDNMQVALDPAIRTWRIRHDAAANAIVYETNDGAWKVQRTIGLPFQIHAVRIQLEADAFNGGAAAPGAAEFDNLVVDQGTCSNADEYDAHEGPLLP